MFDDDPTLDYSKKVRVYIEEFWTQIKDSGKIDSARASYDLAERKARKLITTQTDNALGERVELRICSEPTEDASQLYRILKYHSLPFK